MDDPAVIVDGGHPLHITAVGDLVALCIETVAGAAAGKQLLGAAQVIHSLEGARHALPRSVQADLAVHIHVQRILCLADGSEQAALLLQQIDHEPGNIGDLLGIFSLGQVQDRLVLSLCHDLVAQIGVGHIRHVGIAVQNPLGLVQKGLQLILIAECFFQIHCIHLVFSWSLCVPVCFPLLNHIFRQSTSRPPKSASKCKAPQHVLYYTLERYFLEQDTGLEPAAYCLGSSRSTG